MSSDIILNIKYTEWGQLCYGVPLSGNIIISNICAVSVGEESLKVIDIERVFIFKEKMVSK